MDLWRFIHGVRSFVPLLKAQGEGHIVNTASTAGLQSNAGITPYSVAKLGVVALSETLHRANVGAMLASQGLDPAAVGAMVLAAILTDRFWIVTHKPWIDVLGERVATMREGRLHHGFGG